MTTEKEKKSGKVASKPSAQKSPKAGAKPAKSTASAKKAGTALKKAAAMSEKATAMLKAAADANPKTAYFPGPTKSTAIACDWNDVSKKYNKNCRVVKKSEIV